MQQELPDMVGGAQGEDEIVNKFKMVYETLYNSANTQAEITQLLGKVDGLITQDSLQEVHKVTAAKVKEAAISLKPKKSDVSGSFTSDAILNAPDILFDQLATIFRSFLVHGTLTSYLLACCFLPLLKGSKDPADTGNYRAIAGSSLVLKLFEKVVLLIWGHLLSTDSLQFGFKQKTSTTQCTWLVTEVVQNFLRQGSHPIVTLLDCKAAFDTCKHDILFSRVLDTGVPAIVVRALIYSYREQYSWVRWGQSRSDIFSIRNGTRQGSIASPVLWSVYCDLLLKKLRALGTGAYIAGVFMGAAAYADDLVLIAPTRHAMQQMLAVCEEFAGVYNIRFSTDDNPVKSKTKCIFMVGKALNVRKPVPLKLCGKNLPWVESATHLGHELHQSGTMEHDAKIARARYIDQTVEVRQSFSFASPVEVLRALQVYCSSYYGSLLWNFREEWANKFFNAWTTTVKLTWGCPRPTRTYLVQQVLACGYTSARSEIMARFSKFFRGLLNSPSREVAILANLLGRDIRSATGGNLSLISELTGCNPWLDGQAKIRQKLTESEQVNPENNDKWRVEYLSALLEQKQEWYYKGAQNEVEEVQDLINSLCVN